MATIETTEYLTPDQAAERINHRLPEERHIEAHTVRRYCLNYEHNEQNRLKGSDRLTPEIEAIRVGRSWQIHRDEVERYRKNRKGKGRPSS